VVVVALPLALLPAVEAAGSSPPALSGALVWSAPSHVDGSADASAGLGLTSVSCTSPSFCVAVSASGDALTFNGSRWSAPVKIDVANHNELYVSCASPRFCMAVDAAGDTMRFDGTAWSPPAKVNSHLSLGAITGLSCASASLCMVIGFYGGPSAGGPQPGGFHAQIYNGGSWSAPVPLADGGADAVSCAASGSCVTISGDGEAQAYSDGSWSAPSRFGAGSYGFTSSVSCASASFCAAALGNGEMTIYHGRSWTAPRLVDRAREGFAGISCPSASFCVAVDRHRSAVTFNGSFWSEPATIDSGVLAAVSCVSTAFCVAVDGRGDALIARRRSAEPVS